MESEELIDVASSALSGTEEVETEVVEYVAPEPAEVLRVRFGRAMAVVFDNGTRTIHARIKDAETALSNNEESHDHIFDEYGINVATDPANLGIAFNNGNLSIPVGVGVVMGPANVGKTPVLKWLVSESNKANPGSAKLIRFGEPLPGYITRETEAVSLLLGHLLDVNVKVIAIDSIKDLLGTMGGSLMARGIPREMFVMLSQWGSVAASLGKLIIVPLNISTDNSDALAEVESGVLSNATFAAVATQASGSGFKFDVTARIGEGKRRTTSVLNLSFDSEGVPQITNGSSTKQSHTAVAEDSATQITLSRYALGRALTRVLSKE